MSVIDKLECYTTLSNRINRLRQTLSDVRMIENYESVVQKYNLSKPLVELMKATPGFSSAVGKFPDSTIFNIIPEHKQSVKQDIGLESLEEAQSESVAKLMDDVKSIVDGLDTLLDGLDATASELQSHLSEVKSFIESDELTEEEVGHISLNSIDSDSFAKVFSILEENVPEIAPFNTDDLRANPEKIKDEINDLANIVKEVGAILGLSVDYTGLSDSEKEYNFTPSVSSAEEKGISKSDIIFLIAKADDLCDHLHAIANRREEIITSLTDESENIPSEFSSDDVTYGADEHIMLMTCYVKLISKLIQETIIVASRVIIVGKTIQSTITTSQEEAFA